MAIGVQCDFSTPALAKYGSDHVKEKFLRPSISGKNVSLFIIILVICFFTFFSIGITLVSK